MYACLPFFISPFILREFLFILFVETQDDESLNNIIFGIGVVVVALLLLLIVIKLLHRCYRMWQDDDDDDKNKEQGM